MTPTTSQLEDLCKAHPKLLRKGGLCVALVVTETARTRGLPLDPEDLRTDEGGQVAGLGKGAVLEAHGISKVLAEEGGRTSRGSLGLMKAYVSVLNDLHKAESLDLAEATAWWIQKVRAYFASEGPKFHFDPGMSLRANINDLVSQASDLQASGGGTNYVGAMLQHLVGAKLDVVLGPGKIHHHGFSVADQPTDRKADYQIENVAIHVTTHPSEALIAKCRDNLNAGLKPLIITLGEAVRAAEFTLKAFDLNDRVDVLDAAQFLTANVYERSFFKAAECKVTLSALLARYNSIVDECETDPCLHVKLPAWAGGHCIGPQVSARSRGRDRVKQQITHLVLIASLVLANNSVKAQPGPGGAGQMTPGGGPRVVFRTEPATTARRCTEGLGRSAPPGLPAGSPEEGPAGGDPAGNWGPVDGGAQLSLRLATNRFVLGEMITAYIILRNCGDSILTYSKAFAQGGVCNFDLWDQGPIEHRGVEIRPVLVGLDGPQIPKGAQHRSWARLDKVFDLTQPGRYVVRAISGVIRDSDGNLASVVSAPVQFEIVAAPGDKPKAGTPAPAGR